MLFPEWVRAARVPDEGEGSCGGNLCKGQVLLPPFTKGTMLQKLSLNASEYENIARAVPAGRGCMRAR